MVTKTASIKAGYRKFEQSSVVSRTTAVFKSIYYGLWDSAQAVDDWWRIMSAELESPSDFEAFKILYLNHFYSCLGTPDEVLEYTTPWDAFLEEQRFYESAKQFILGESLNIEGVEW